MYVNTLKEYLCKLLCSYYGDDNLCLLIFSTKKIFDYIVFEDYLSVLQVLFWIV